MTSLERFLEQRLRLNRAKSQGIPWWNARALHLRQALPKKRWDALGLAQTPRIWRALDEWNAAVCVPFT